MRAGIIKTREGVNERQASMTQQAEMQGMAQHAAAQATEAAQAAAAHAAAGAEKFDPLHQFHIKPLVPIRIGELDFSFTNSSLWMVIAVAVVSLVFLLGKNRIVPHRLQSIRELAYEFVANVTRDILHDEGRPFFPFIFTLFVFILAANLLGMIPYSFTFTSHIIVTFALAMVVFVLATVVGFVKNGVRYLKLFVPSGVPVYMLPVLVPIEVISYFTRPISLSVRLFANMMAGHTMLKVFASFVVALGFIGGWAPLAMMVALTGLEFLVAFLQAYVFMVLSVIYLSDALHPEH